MQTKVETHISMGSAGMTSRMKYLLRCSGKSLTTSSADMMELETSLSALRPQYQLLGGLVKIIPLLFGV
jgi:hypothetical protein